MEELLTRGGVYLVKLDLVKSAEVGKIRPVIILNSQLILNCNPPVVFICPLSSKSQPEFSSLHFKINARDNLQVVSYALVEHCRSISRQRIIYPRLTQINDDELMSTVDRLQTLIGL